MNKWLSLLFLVLTACQSATSESSAPSRSPLPLLATPTLFSPSGASGQKSIAVTSRTLNQLRFGEPAALRLEFQAVLYRATFRPDGTILAASATRLDASDVAQMQICYAPNQCQLRGLWIPFRPLQDLEIRADWWGVREFQLRAQFRDGDGKIIPSYRDAYVGPKDETIWTAQLESTLDERTPIALFPASIQTAVAATRAAFPVSGTVKIAEGRSIIGARAGEMVRVRVEFGASTPFGGVNEMRVLTFNARHCANEKEIAQVAWEKFVAEKFYTVTVPINFSSFDVSAQYRDTQGNLSSVICGDLVIEGMPSGAPSRAP